MQQLFIIPEHARVQCDVGIEHSRMMEKGIDDRETPQGMTHEYLIRSGAIEGVDVRHQLIADEAEEFFTAACTAERGTVRLRVEVMSDMGRCEVADTVRIGDGYYNELREIHGAAADLA